MFGRPHGPLDRPSLGLRSLNVPGLQVVEVPGWRTRCNCQSTHKLLKVIVLAVRYSVFIVLVKHKVATVTIASTLWLPTSRLYLF